MVVPIWFAVDDDGTLLFTTWGETHQGQGDPPRRPRVSLCVDEEQPPYAYVRVDGLATIVDDPRVAAHLGGRASAVATWAPSRPAQFGERNGVPGELLVRDHADDDRRPGRHRRLSVYRTPQLRAVFGHGANPRVL